MTAFLAFGAAFFLGASCDNQPPEKPTLSGMTSTETTISGTVSACVDDGKIEPCILKIRAVTAGGAPADPPLGDGIATLPLQGGGFTLTGLAPDTPYAIFADAFDGAKTTASDPASISTFAFNTPPDAPSITTTSLASPNRKSITGTVTPCVDDGLPAPPNQCAQRVLAFPTPFTDQVICNEDCSDCVLEEFGSPVTPDEIANVEPDGTFTFVNLSDYGDEFYDLFAISDDSEFAVCGARERWLTSASDTPDCYKHIASQTTVIPQDLINGPTDGRGVRAEWFVRDLQSIDFLGGGFAQQHIFTGVGGLSMSQKWIEVGITSGFGGTNAFTKFAGYGVAPLFGNSTFMEVQIPDGGGAPPLIGTSPVFRIENCITGATGCNGPHSGDGDVWIACVDTQCHAIEGHAGPGIIDFLVGNETTCEANRVDKTLVRDIQFKDTTSWININNPNNGFTPSDSDLGRFSWPDPVPPSGNGADGPHVECCTGDFIDSDGIRHCNDPGKVRHWNNSQISTTGCSF